MCVCVCARVRATCLGVSAPLLTHPRAAWLMALLHACAAGLGTAPVLLASGMGVCWAQRWHACSQAASACVGVGTCKRALGIALR